MEREERKIQGILTAWGEIKTGLKEDRKTPWSAIEFIIDNGNQKHRIFSGGKEALFELVQLCPEGSLVEFTEFKKGNFWNMKDGSFNIVRKTETPLKKTRDFLKLEIMFQESKEDLKKIYDAFAEHHDVKFSQSHQPVIKNEGASYRAFYSIYVWYKELEGKKEAEEPENHDYGSEEDD